MCVLTSTLVAGSWPARVAAAAEYYGQVIFGGLAVPGATVTATQGDMRLTTTTDAQGIFRIQPTSRTVAWTIRIEMRGFANLTREVTIGPDAQPVMWELSLLPFEEITRGLRHRPLPRPARAPESEQPDRHALADERAELRRRRQAFSAQACTAPQTPAVSTGGGAAC